MIYSNVDFNVVYIDPSIEAPGDGTTPAGALKALPASAADFTDFLTGIVDIDVSSGGSDQHKIIFHTNPSFSFLRKRLR